MATNSGIEWTEATWNPIVGCTVISPGCTNCYAMRMARRLEAMGQPKYEGVTRISGGRAKWTGAVKFDNGSVDLPKKWTKGRLIFVNSMSDLFHEGVSFEYICKIFDVIRDTPQHTYQILTKRSSRLRELSPMLAWPRNVWMGVSVENVDYVSRIDDLRTTGAAVKFLSLEPLLGPLDELCLEKIDWVIAGGESGPMARTVDPNWVRSIRDQCERAGVAFHFKQWGGVNKKRNGRILDNRTWDDVPKAACTSLNCS